MLLQICWLHIHNANLPFHHIPKMFYWIEIWWMWGSFKYSELIVMFKKRVWDDFELCDRVHYTAGRSNKQMGTLWPKWMGMVRNNTQMSLNDAQLALEDPKCARKMFPSPFHHQQLELLIQDRMVSCFHSDSTVQMLQQKCRRIRPCNILSSLLLSSFGDPLWITDSVSCS